MAEYTPTTFYKGDLTEVAYSWSDHWELVWNGWRLAGPAPAQPSKTGATLQDVEEALEDYVNILPDVATYTYNPDGTVATETVEGKTTTYSYNSDGSLNTMTRGDEVRTFSYNPDGTLSGVS